MKYFCLCDLDGTLLDDNGQIDSNTSFEINRIKNDIRLILVSKANYNKLKELKDKYSLDVDLFSTETKRAQINSKEFYSLLSNKTIKDLITTFDKYIYTAYGDGKNNGFIYKYIDRLSSLYPKAYKEEITDMYSIKFSIYNDTYDDFIKYLDNNDLSYEVILKDYKKALINVSMHPFDKAYAYNLAQKEYNCKSIGITDSITDKEMLEHCNVKIAMLNGDLEIKQYCQMISKYDNNNQGVIKELVSLL